MSMYGTIYYQAAQGFAKFFLKNLGRNNKTFLQEKLEDSEVEAKTRSTSFSFETGNRWIELEPKDNSVAVWHAAPSNSISDLSMTYGMQKVSNPGNIQAEELHSGDVIKIPLIYFDAAGHVSPVNNNAVYYKMPTVDIEADISDLQTDVTQLQSDVTTIRSNVSSNTSNIGNNSRSIKTIQSQFGDITNTNKDGQKDLCSVVGNLSALQTTYFNENEKLTVCDTIGETKKQVDNLDTDFSSFVKSYNIAYSDLLDRIRALEETKANSSS